MGKEQLKANPKEKSASAKLVVKGNKLVNARYNLGLSEMRLFLSMITQIRRDDVDFKTYRIQISEFAEALGTSSKNLYERAQETSKKLMEEVLVIEEEDGPLQLALLSSAKYYKGKGYVDLSFDPKLKPYLLQLKEKFTAYDIRNVLQLRSAHSIRIYELLKQYEKIGERTLGLEELKELLGLENQYAKYNDFKRFVLLQAQKELELHCDISFEFEAIKQGRKVEIIRFLIFRKRPQAQQEIQANSDLNIQLRSMGLSPKQIKKVTAEHTEEAIQSALSYTQERYRKTLGTKDEIHNLPAYLLTVLDSGVREPDFIKKEQTQRQQSQKDAQQEQRKAAEEAAIIEQLQEGFRAHRMKHQEKLVAQASEEEWKAFTSHVHENPYMAKKLLQNNTLNRRDDETRSWLGSYLIDRDWPDTPENFMSWAYNFAGYQIVPDKKSPSNYTITGRQEKLF